MERTTVSSNINATPTQRSQLMSHVLCLLVIIMTKSIQSTEAGGRNEYCPGFIDKHGQWNNGFQCPKWGEQGQRYCCGTDSFRFCCPSLQPTVPLLRTITPAERTKLHQHALLVTFIFGTLILISGTTVIMCFRCRCCLVYQRRKRSHREAGYPIEGHLANRRRIWGFDPSMSNSRAIQPESIALSPPSYQEDEPPAYDELTVPHISKEKHRHKGGFDEDRSESPSKCLSIGLCRFNNETKRLSYNQTTTLVDLNSRSPTSHTLTSNLRHYADASHHTTNARGNRSHGGESSIIEALNERLLIGGRQITPPISSGMRDQPTRDRKQEICLQSGETQCCSISLHVSSSMNNKCQSETESDECSGDGYQLASEDCISIASATMATDSEDEVRNSLRSYVNRYS